jgi:ribonucleoside-diphosphate reductase alpha chain
LAKGEEQLPDYFVTAHDVTPEEHVKMQAAIQRWVDASIAKTVNAPKHHTIDDVRSLYMMAYDSGCKGITYYRDGSREGVLIKEDTDDLPAYPAKRAVLNDAPARRIKIKTGCGDLWLTCVFDECSNLREVFTVTGHDGGCAANTEALSRMISCSLRYDLPLTEIVRQLSETKPCRSFDRLKQRDKTVKAKSCPDAIARQLSEYVARVKAEIKQPKKPEQPAQIRKYLATCPDCGSLSLAKAEGCQTCNVCGFSKCG